MTAILGKRDELIELLIRIHACNEALMWVKQQDDNITLAGVWETCPRGDWLMWLARQAEIDLPRAAALSELLGELEDRLEPYAEELLGAFRRWMTGNYNRDDLHRLVKTSYLDLSWSPHFYAHKAVILAADSFAGRHSGVACSVAVTCWAHALVLDDLPGRKADPAFYNAVFLPKFNAQLQHAADIVHVHVPVSKIISAFTRSDGSYHYAHDRA
jgi:hypothetical protein